MSALSKNQSNNPSFLSEKTVVNQSSDKQLSVFEAFIETSLLSGSNAAFLEDLFESFLRDSTSVSSEWQQFFDSFKDLSQISDQQNVFHSDIREQFAQLARKIPLASSGSILDAADLSNHDRKQAAVMQLVVAYRSRGHQKANLDPLGLMNRSYPEDTTLEFQGLSSADLDSVFNTGNLSINKSEATLQEIVSALEETYCGSVGAEFLHIVPGDQRRWIQNRMELVRSKPTFSKQEKLHILEKMIAAEGLEKSLASKYPGFKRFGLEGGEGLIPFLDEVIQRSGKYLCKEIVIGMAHRGRLNVLINILGKKPSDLFGEFEGKKLFDDGSGDVKYHQGFSSNVNTPGGEVHLALAFNPSHLEIVSPVVEGSVRARQDRREDEEGGQVIPVLVHGDAAFAGQGVVMETLQMSQTRGYKTGGTIHVIVNNQVGFTTSKQVDSRSTEYCTNVAKMVQAPIFHVNGDDPEAVIFVTQLAVDFRKSFKKDVVIDLICYRKHGHNETDEPAITQPQMYKKVRSIASPTQIYIEQLIAEQVIDKAQADDMRKTYRKSLEEGNHMVQCLVVEPKTKFHVDWSPYVAKNLPVSVDTSYPVDALSQLGKVIAGLPEGFVVHRQVQKILDDRMKMASGSLDINWGFAEIAAYATLAKEGHPIRITGQDSGRGTFSHRHAVMHEQSSGDEYIALQKIAEENGTTFEIFDSLLSEEAVLGFEYGYATTQPQGLVIWEAQFGDFANGAQVVIDQFISSGEHKWSRLCGLTMLLPHGYEGQGPEHSSARLERFLQLSAEKNIQVCVPSTPSQIYHLLRRQAVRNLRKPLIVMTPKSLLRHKLCVSTLSDLANGSFQLVLPEKDDLVPHEVDRVVMCSGRVYYDLLEKRRASGSSNTAIIRIEQLYPFPKEELVSVLKVYKNLKQLVWCQEEPKNQGAWFCTQHRFISAIEQLDQDVELLFSGRPASAAPASGYMSLHIEQQEKLINEALNLV